jgi:hypothetical protein
LLPPSPAEWLPENHLAYFVLETLDELELGAIEHALQAKDPRGERSYSPRLMVGLLIYGYFEWTFLCLTHNLLKLFRRRNDNDCSRQPDRRAPVVAGDWRALRATDS